MKQGRDEIDDTELLYGLASAAAEAPMEPGALLRARVARSFARGGRYGRFADRVARIFDLPVERAETLLARVEDPSVFVPFTVQGVHMHYFRPGPKHAGAIAAFGRLDPGVHFPEHGHVGDETTFVLEGGFRDHDAREVWRGEELFKPAGSSHDFVVIGGEVCVAAVLAIGGIELR